MHSKYFCLTVRFEIIFPWWLLVTTAYTCCTSIIYLREYIFCFIAWPENILQFLLSGKPVPRSSLKTWFQLYKQLHIPDFLDTIYITRKIKLKMMWLSRNTRNQIKQFEIRDYKSFFICSESNITPLQLFHKKYMTHIFQKRSIEFLKLTTWK